MVPSTPIEILPLDAPIASIDSVLAINAPNSVQQETPCLPTSTSWDDFLPNITVLFVGSYTEDVGDIIDGIHLLFDEEDPSLVVMRAHSNPLVHSLHDQFSQIDVIMDPQTHEIFVKRNILFVEENSSLVTRAHSNPHPLDVTNMIMDIYL